MKVIIVVVVPVLGFLGLLGVISGQPVLMSVGFGGANFMLTVGSNVG